MRFSVIIPTCNRNEMLRKCLDLLEPSVQKMDSHLYEVIVSDDSQLSTAKQLINDNYKWVKWLEGPHRGPAANRNYGARYAKGDWLIFIDDDCLPDQNILQAFYEAIGAYPDVNAFEGAILPDDWEKLKIDLAECPTNIKGNCFWSANICVKKDLFKKLNGFNEEFLIAAQEDQYLFFEIKKETKVKFLSNAKVVHPVRFTTLNYKIKRNKNSVRNWLLYTQKTGNSFGQSMITGYKSQLVDFKRNILTFKLKSCILNLHTIFICLPYFIIKHEKNKF